MSEEDVPGDGEARRRREEGCRREEAIRGLLKRHGDKRLTIIDVEAVAWELGVSRPTMYRLIVAYRAKGTVSSVEPRAMGRRKDAFVLDAKRERLIASAIQEIYLKPERPTMTYLIEQVRARCAQKGLPLPDRRTIKARESSPIALMRALLVQTWRPFGANGCNPVIGWALGTLIPEFDELARPIKRRINHAAVASLPISFRPALLAGLSRAMADPAVLDAIRDETILRGRRAFDRLREQARIDAHAAGKSHPT